MESYWKYDCFSWGSHGPASYHEYEIVKNTESYVYKVLILAAAVSLVSGCESNRRELSKLCHSVMSKDAPIGQVKIYNKDQSFPDKTCSCFSKMETKDDRITSSLIFYDLLDVQYKNQVTADKAFDVLIRNIQSDGRIRVYGINRRDGGVSKVRALRNRLGAASHLSAQYACKK